MGNKIKIERYYLLFKTKKLKKKYKMKRPEFFKAKE